ncbi:MAG: family 1 glycosylhydrolase [Pseudomonadota bacterium]
MACDHTSGKLALWGGLECTINRVGDQFFNQMARNGHDHREGDLERFASLGIEAIRYPVLWERTAPHGPGSAQWDWSDRRLGTLATLGITPIVGLVHHGSGPFHTSLVDPGFAPQLARFAGAVAQRYPWVEYYTPVNEPLTTARFSGLYGLWYPHAHDERSFVQALLNQCRAIVLSMAAIRRVNPHAKLVQTDDLGKNYGTPEMAQVTAFYNERRWLAWDLLCGRVGPEHPLWEYLCRSGVDQAELLWLRDHPCPPDIIGLNYYVTGERWLDHRVARYPQRYIGNYPGWHHADIETARALAIPTPGIGPLLHEVWQRYRLPMAVTEAHIDSTREDQLRWLLEIWRASEQARRQGVDLRAVTVWALLGSYDWNSLVTRCEGYYESGPFDVRSPQPRETALAGMMRELSAGRTPSHPVLAGSGWWRRPGRCFCPPVAMPAPTTAILPHVDGGAARPDAARPILIVGANGTLGRAFARLCQQRNLAYHLLSRQQLDISQTGSVAAAIGRYRPWAIVNAGGYVRVDRAEFDSACCFRDNALGPAILARACAEHAIALMTFSSDLVFDGRQQRPYVEGDPVAPLNCYGRSKAEAERLVLEHDPAALVIRSSAFFGPWDGRNFLAKALAALSHGAPFAAARDMTVSPTYVPDLVHVSLDLLVDGERGLWHLTNGDIVTWEGLALKAANMAGVDASRLESRTREQMAFVAPRPAYSPLQSERAKLLPSLTDAMTRFITLRQQAAPNLSQGGQLLWHSMQYC